MSTSKFADQVYDHISAQLMERMLRPGERHDRKQIVQELDVSLIPVADAVHRLTHDGFLTTRRRHGTLVTTPNREDVCGQLLQREALECQGARRCCGERVKPGRRSLLPLARAADKGQMPDGSSGRKTSRSIRPWSRSRKWMRWLLASRE